jgi:predicted phage replisome organizer
MRERKFVKLRVDMYEDTKFKIIDKMPERDVIHYVWARLLALCGKVNLNGELYMSKNIPYTIETLAIEFNREAAEVRLALGTFIKLEMVELRADGVYIVKNFVKHQNIKVEKTPKTAVKASENMATSSEESAESNNVISLNNVNISTDINTNQVDSIKHNAAPAQKIQKYNANNTIISIEPQIPNGNNNSVKNIKSDKNIIFTEDAASDKIDQKNLGLQSQVIETSEKDKKTKKVRSPKKKVTNVISFDETYSNEVLMEISSGEPKLGKDEVLINSFSF